MKKSECAQLVMTLFNAFPNARTTDAAVEAYERHLIDLDANVAKSAIDRMVGTCTFLPSIAELRSACVDLSSGPCRTGAEGWIDALAEVDRTGFYRVPKFSDPMVAETMRLFGSWEEFCSMPTDEHMSARARFIELYDSLSKRGRADAQSGVPLPSAKPPERMR